MTTAEDRAVHEAAAAHAQEAEHAGSKRKEPETAPPRPKPSFKVIAHMVVAMKRFSNSLNPTYTYGKRADPTSSGGGSKVVTEDIEAPGAVNSSAGGGKRLSTGAHAVSPRPTSPEAHDHGKYAYSTHGHKFDFLMKPLPPTEDEEAEAEALAAK